jgi:adenylate cyclase
MTATRRLAAILAADVAGYSRLMGVDEEGTLERLKAHRRELIDPKITEHRGRIVKTTGDGILVEFASAVDAARCAVELQRAMAERASGTPQDKRIEIRIGIHVGDIIIDHDDIFGDGVNIAARLEGIAEPGGITISGAVHEQVRDRLPYGFDDCGDQSMKNIVRPVRVYRVRANGSAIASSVATRPSPDVSLTVPDKPSIAVLPFQNMSGDPEQGYFADGITADIITELSRFSELLVIAPNSSFQYKGKSVDVRQVGRELGVLYVLEGSIRRNRDRVRISVQLIDAATGAHRWAERYDRELEDIFAVQDEVARTIVAILSAYVNKAEVERTLLKPPTAWQAYDYYMRATDTFASYWASFRVRDLYETRRLLQHSLSVDPNYARAYVTLSLTYTTAWFNPLDADHLSPAALDRAYQLALKGVQLDPNLPEGHAQLGVVLASKRQHEASVGEFERAIALNSNYSDWRFALCLVLAGEPKRAIAVCSTHMRLDPFYPPWVPGWLGLAYYMLERYLEALTPLRECVSRAPDFQAGHSWLAATYAQLGRLEEARPEAAEVLRIEPSYTIHRTPVITALKRSRDADLLRMGLRKAGLSER